MPSPIDTPNWNITSEVGKNLILIAGYCCVAGVTGDLIASDLTGKIGAIGDIAISNSFSSSREVSQGGADDIKVEIPETGVSLGQAWRYLRLWFGHERQLSGNLRLAGDKKATLTVMLDGARVASVSGYSGDLDRLEQRAAERVFANLDPKNMVLYLRATGRTTDTLAAAERLVKLEVSPMDQADANTVSSHIIRSITGNMPLAWAHARIAEALYPKLQVAQLELMWDAVLMGHDQTALNQALTLPSFREEDQPETLRGRGFAGSADEGAFERHVLLGPLHKRQRRMNVDSVPRRCGYSPAQNMPRARMTMRQATPCLNNPSNRDRQNPWIGAPLWAATSPGYNIIG